MSVKYFVAGLAGSTLLATVAFAQTPTATTDRATQKSLYNEAQGIASHNAWQLTLFPFSSRLAIYKTLHGVWIEPSEAEPVFSDAWLSQ